MVKSLKAVGKILRHRGSPALAKLLSRAFVDFEVSDTYGRFLNSYITTVVIYAPISDCDRLRSLSREDDEQVLDAVLEIWPPEEDMEITGVEYRIDPDSLKDFSDDAEGILQQLDHLRNIMIAVSTGGPKINDVNRDYKARHLKLTRELAPHGFQNPIPYTDLWGWYGKWSSGDLPSYQSRRDYIRGLCKPLETRLCEGPSSRGADAFPEPTGWSRVDRTLGEARARLQSALNAEEFQTVGLLCRETLISLAETVFNPGKHPPLDQAKVSNTDAKRMLDRYLAVEVAGKSNATIRKHAKVALDLANELQHQRTAVFRNSALCVEATASVVNIIAILSGVRDPEAGTI